MNVSNLTEIQALAKPLFERFQLKQAAVFGSFARNENRQDSDVDLIVDFIDTYDLLDLIGLKQELEDALGRKVDLVTFKSIADHGNAFGEIVLREAKTIYEKN